MKEVLKKKTRLFKRIIASVLTMAMMFSMSGVVFAEDENEREAEYYTPFVSYDLKTGEETTIQVPHYADTPNYTLPSGVSEFEGVKEAIIPEISEYNFTSDWSPVNNVNNDPYNGIVKLYATYSGGPDGNVGHGTGFVVGDGKIMTAAHILNDSGKGGRPTSLKLTFLKNGSSGNTYTVSSANCFYPVWDGTPATDYGFIKIPTVGKYRFGLYAGVYSGTNYTISGYPILSGRYDGNKMFTDSATGATLSSRLDGTVKHNINICAGISGAPMYGSNNYAVAIQTRGFSDLVNSSAPSDEWNDGALGGFATLVTQAAIDFVRNL